jgi:hypothetical protein
MHFEAQNLALQIAFCKNRAKCIDYFPDFCQKFFSADRVNLISVLYGSDGQLPVEG